MDGYPQNIVNLNHFGTSRYIYMFLSLLFLCLLNLYVHSLIDSHNSCVCGSLSVAGTVTAHISTVVSVEVSVAGTVTVHISTVGFLERSQSEVFPTLHNEIHN